MNAVQIIEVIESSIQNNSISLENIDIHNIEVNQKNIEINCNLKIPIEPQEFHEKPLEIEEEIEEEMEEEVEETDSFLAA